VADSALNRVWIGAVSIAPLPAGSGVSPRRTTRHDRTTGYAGHSFNVPDEAEFRHPKTPVSETTQFPHTCI